MSILRSEKLDVRELLNLLSRVRQQTLGFFGASVETSLKSDKSPITAADIANHELLVQQLGRLRAVPVWSEEDYPEFSERQKTDEYWLIDPLDGTKEFTQGMPDFSVLISLMKSGRPVFSAIAIPAKDQVFVAELGKGIALFKEGEESAIHAHSQERFSVGLLSRFHEEVEVSDFYSRRGLSQNLKLGSALKFCALVTDEADVYFRHKGPHEWDVAAGDLLVNESGGMLVTWPDLKVIQYNQEGTRVPAFLGVRKSARKKFSEV